MTTNTAPAHPDQDWQTHWRRTSALSAKELAKLCCGSNSSSDAIPDPVAYNQALEAIVRAVRVDDLQPIDLSALPATREELFYGDAPLFRMSVAIAWAAPRFRAFPYSAPAQVNDTTLDGAGQVGAEPRRDARALRQMLQ
jgi:hypothetical protein